MHFCQPCEEDKEAYYPAYREAVVAFMLPLTQLPYMINPASADAWLYARVFVIIYYPLLSIVLILRYFKLKKLYLNWWLITLTGASALLLGLLFVHALINDIENDKFIRIVVISSFVLSLILNVYMIKVLLWLKRMADKYNSETYSNSDDFPYKFALKIGWVPLAWAVVAWGEFITDSRWVKLVADIVFTIIQIGVMISILKPNKRLIELASSMEDMPGCDIDEEEMLIPLDEKILLCMETKLMFLNSHLTIQNLADDVKSNRTYVSLAIKQKYGSFYDMVNSYRYEFAEHFSIANPGATREQIAATAGFGSVKSYMRATERFSKDKESEKH